MSFEYLADPSRPTWAGLLPGKPATYFLGKGEGEHAKLFGDTFSVLLSGDETGGQFGIFTATCPVGDIIPTYARADTHETFFILEQVSPCSNRATSASCRRVCCTPIGSSRRRT